MLVQCYLHALHTKHIHIFVELHRKRARKHTEECGLSFHCVNRHLFETVIHSFIESQLWTQLLRTDTALFDRRTSNFLTSSLLMMRQDVSANVPKCYQSVKVIRACSNRKVFSRSTCITPRLHPSKRLDLKVQLRAINSSSFLLRRVEKVSAVYLSHN